jgi:signal peptidase I
MSDQQKDENSSYFSKKAGTYYKKFIYMGSSMYPTLKPADILEVIPYKKQKVRCGDVIVFSHPEEHNKIVHRVISVDSNGIKTRGDNSKEADSWVLEPGNIQGYVINYQRKSKQRQIMGSIAGPLLSKALRSAKLIYWFMSGLLYPIYLRLAQKGINSEKLNAFLKIRVISFCRPAGEEFHLLIGRRVIGRRLPGQVQWQIKFPFRLFIDEKFLVNINNPHA